jgi:hypothetical protein
MSIATDTDLTGDLPSLARALSDRVRTLVRMHAAAGSGLSPRAKNGRRSPAQNTRHQFADVQAGKMPESESAGVHNCHVLARDTIDQKRQGASFQNTSALQNQQRFTSHDFQQCGSIADSSDGAHSLFPRQLQPQASHAVSTASKADCTAATALREADANVGDSGSSTGYHEREPSLRVSAAPFSAVPTCEQAATHMRHGSARLQEGSHSDSTLTAPPDPFSLCHGKLDSHRAASGRQSGIVAVSMMPGGDAADDVDDVGQQQRLWQFDEQGVGGRRHEGSAMRLRKEDSIQSSEGGASFRGDDRRHLKGELESVRAMIAEMQELRTAVQHGDLDVAMVLLPLSLPATNPQQLMCTAVLCQLPCSGNVMFAPD